MPSTKTAEIMTGVGTIVQNEPIVAANGVSETPEAIDQFGIPHYERKELGIEDHESFAWIRNPSIWEKDEKSNRFTQFRREHGGAGQVVMKDGEPVTQGDLMLVTYPKTHDEMLQAALAERGQGYIDEVEQRAERGSERDRDELREMSRRGRMEAIRAGMTGEHSPTSGRSYEDAVRGKTEQDIIAEEARFRRENRRTQHFDNDAWAAQVDRNQPAKGKPRISIAVPATGLGTTTQEKVAARAGGKKG